MKEEGDDRYNRIDERTANMEKKFSTIEEAGKTETGEYDNVQEDQNRGEAVATGFHGDSTEQEVKQLLRETITEIGVSTENVQIKCSAKPIAYAFMSSDISTSQIGKHIKERVEREENITVNRC